MTLAASSTAAVRRDRPSRQRLAEHYVAGRSVPAAGDRTLERRDPVTGGTALVLVAATPDEV